MAKRAETKTVTVCKNSMGLVSVWPAGAAVEARVSRGLTDFVCMNRHSIANNLPAVQAAEYFGKVAEDLEPGKMTEASWVIPLKGSKKTEGESE